MKHKVDNAGETAIASPTRPKILVISHVLPYPTRAGNEIRILNMLRWFRHQGLEIILLLNHDSVEPERRIALLSIVDHLYFVGDEYDGELRPMNRKRKITQRMAEVFSRLLGHSHVHRHFFGQSRIARRESVETKRWLANDRLIQVAEWLCRKHKASIALGEYIFTAPCLEALPGDITKLIDTHDMFSRKKEQVLRYGIYDPLPCTRREERTLLSAADIVIAIQPNEADMFRRLLNGRTVITTGIDFDVLAETNDARAVAGRVMIVGSDNPLNIHGLAEFIDNAWPLIKESVPHATLRVIGRLAEHVDSTVTGIDPVGWVRDIGEEYASASVVVNATVAGTGLKIKSVEALCQGKALVTTSNGVEGLDFSDLAPFVVQDEWNEFAKEVSNLLTSDQLRETLQSKALAYARTHFNPKAVYAELAHAMGRFLNDGFTGKSA